MVDVEGRPTTAQHETGEDLVGAIGPVMKQKLQCAVAEDEKRLSRLHGYDAVDCVVRSGAEPCYNSWRLSKLAA